MSRILRNDKRGRGKDLDRAVGHIAQVPNGSAHQEQGARHTGGHTRLAAGRLLRRVLLELLRQRRLADEADDLIDQLPVLEEQDSGD